MNGFQTAFMIETTLDSQRRLVVIRMSGVIADEDLVAAPDGGRADPIFPPGFRQLIDLSDVTQFDLSPAAVKLLAGSSSVVPGTRRAILAPGDVPFGLSRVFAAYSEPYGHNVQVFRCLGDALRWLDGRTA